MNAFTVVYREGVALATLDLPDEPVNKITRAVRGELETLLSTWRRDDAVKAVVLQSGKPDTFIAGADIEEFVRLSSRDEAFQLVRTGQALIERVANLGKPVVAAIHGACVGGGLEAALACTYRVATDHEKTRLGLPEVQLGILPAAGGCQRLPRLIGVRGALDIILAGKILPAASAFRRGMVDDLVHPAILTEVAIKAAKRLATGWQPRRRVAPGLMGLLLDRNAVGRALVYSQARKQVMTRTGGQYPGPLAALDAVAHGMRYGMEAGLDTEAALFAELAVSAVSRELVRIFFASTALKKDRGAEAEPREIKRIGVVGAGFMGAGIGGTAVAQAGVDVRFKDADLAAVGRGLSAARKILDDRLKRRRMLRFEHKRQVALLSGGTDWSGFGSADLVIEAVFEDLDVKQQVFRDLETVTRADAVLASNTSTIPIADIARGTRHPERVLGMHFFSPVEKMPLLEVIAHDGTAPWAVATAVDAGKQMGKTVVVVRDHPGFWVNRILTPYLNEAGRLVMEGVDVEKIDAVMRRWGFPVGPVTLLDEVGLDVAVKAGAVMHAAFGDRLAPVAGLDRLVAAGRKGRKTGKGFFRYAKGRKQGVDTATLAMLGVAPATTLDDTTIEARLVWSMLNEAAMALDEDVVRSARDGDMAAVFGIGFPPFRGGPLRWLDHIGPAASIELLRALADQFGARFQPAPVLERLANSNSRFHANHAA
jgi:3-hydroxyacyl-CoA dehydrogenase/enoyl-CoA hydratase/3-hydroxybutyryl-CoA epimerase